MSTIQYTEDSPYINKPKDGNPIVCSTDYKYNKFMKLDGDEINVAKHLRVLNVAIFGLGRAGLIHLGHVMKNPRLRLRYAVDEDPVKLKMAQKKWQLDDDCLCTADHIDSRVLQDDSLRGVIICTPTYTHENLICRSIKARKGVFCEKPIGENIEETSRCYDLAESMGMPLFCAFNRRFDPSFSHLRSRVQAGDVGRVHTIKTVARDSPLPSIEYLKISGGIFHDCAVHDIDLICWILGEYPTSVIATGHAFIPEIKEIGDYDTVAIILKFQSGTIGCIDISRNAVYGYDQRIEVMGPKGMISANNERPMQVVVESIQCQEKVGMYHSFPSRYEQAYINELEHFCDILQGLSELSISGDNTLRISKIASALETSVKNGAFVDI